MSSAVLEARAIITGEDKTGPAFASAEARIKELAGQTRRIGEASASIAKVSGAVDRVSASVGTSSAAFHQFVESARAVDAVSASVAKAQKSMPQVAALQGGMAKAVAEVTAAERAFTAETNRLDMAGQKLSIFKALQSGFATTRTTFNEASAEVQRLGRDMAAAEAPSKALSRDYAEAQRAVSAAAGAFEAQKSAMIAAKREFEALAGPLSTIASAEARLAKEAGAASHALAGQGAAAKRGGDEIAAALQRETVLHERMQKRRQAWHQVSDELLPFAGPVILEGTKKAAEEGGKVQHERVGLVNAGRTPVEIEEIERASRDTSAKLPTATYEQNLKIIAETTSAFGSLHHAIENLPFMQQTMSILHAAAGDKIQGGPGEIGRQLAKFFEDRQTKPEDFQKEASQLIPAMVATGGVFNPNEMYNFALQAKSSLPNYDMEFLSKYMPALIARSNGERTGTAANAFTSLILGKANDKKQAEAWENLGLLDPTKAISKAGHVVSWQAGAIKNTDLALQNPVRWAEETLIPALKSHGVNTDDRMEVTKALGTLFRNQNANYWANEITQAQSLHLLHKDADLTTKVGSADDIYKRNLTEDPTVALKALGSSFETLMATLTSPVMKDASGVMAHMAEGLASISKALGDFNTANPEIAKLLGGTALAGGAGVGTYLTSKLFTNLAGLFGGGGLTASATALDGAAAQLTGAAIALRGGAVAKVVEDGLPVVTKGLPLLAGAGPAGAAAAALTVFLVYASDPDKIARPGGHPDIAPKLNEILPGLDDVDAFPVQHGLRPSAAGRGATWPGPVTHLSTDHAFPPGLHGDHTLDNHGVFSPGYGADEHFDAWPRHHAPAVDTAAVHPTGIDDSAIMAFLGKTREAQDALIAFGAMVAAPKIDMASLDAWISKIIQAKSLYAGLATGGDVRTTGSVGPSRIVSRPGGTGVR